VSQRSFWIHQIDAGDAAQICGRPIVLIVDFGLPASGKSSELHLLAR
jgi:hypothetical protein